MLKVYSANGFCFFTQYLCLDFLWKQFLVWHFIFSEWHIFPSHNSFFQNCEIELWDFFVVNIEQNIYVYIICNRKKADCDFLSNNSDFFTLATLYMSCNSEFISQELP